MRLLRSWCLRALPWIAVLACLAVRPATADSALRVCGNRSGGATQAWILADFDGDQKPDLAVLNTGSGTGAGRITVRHLEAGSFPATCSLISSEKLRARDLDGDADRDLVLETATEGPIAVWLNDGAGNFSQADVAPYRYQLSHTDPRSFCSLAPEPFSFDPAECPTSGIAARRPQFGITHVGTDLTAATEQSGRGGFTLSVWGRGPPSPRS